MAKLRLDVDELDVQSFETAEDAGERGTVAANEAATRQCSARCTEDPSCGIWCPPTDDPNSTGPCLC